MSVPLLRIALATGLASIGLAAGGTGGALLATELVGNESVAGLPFAAVVAGSAIGAVLVSGLTLRIGRGRALAAGYGLGVIGAGIAILAAVVGSVELLLAGSLLLGPANASVFLARYAGADLAGTARRGAGLGTILFAAAIGAVIAPNLLGPSGAVVALVGLSPFTGLYLVALLAFGLGAAILGIDAAAPVAVSPASGMAPARSVRGLVVLGAANLAMVGIMAIAPVHLTAHGHDLGFVGLAVSVHVAGMLLPSPITGWLSDRNGTGVVAAGGALLTIAAAGWGATADPSSAGQATGFLLLLGLGWNLAVVSGSAMIIADAPPHARPGVEAAGEVTMSLAAAVGAVGAGLLASAGGWPLMIVTVGAVGGLALAGLSPGVPGARHRRREAGTMEA